MALPSRPSSCAAIALLASILPIPCAAAAPVVVCVHQRLARVPLRDDGGFLSLPATIAGAPIRLMLDTGSEAGLITPEAVRGLGIATDDTRPIRMQGTGGDGRAAGIARIQRLAIGQLTLDTLLIPIGPLPGAPNLTPPIIGFLGGDVLSQFDLDIDLPHATLSIWRIRAPSLACARAPFWQPPFARVMLSPHGVRLSLDAWLDEHKISALLDTGARSLILSGDAARRAGVTQAELDTEPGGTTSGVDMRPKAYHWHRFASLRIGNETILKPVLTVAPLAGSFDMLLGTDWLKSREIWISYAEKELYVK